MWRKVVKVTGPASVASVQRLTALEDRARVGGNTRPHIGALLGNRARDGRALHLTLVVDDDTSVVLEVDEDTLLSAPGLALTNDDSRVHLLSQLRLSLLAGSHDQITHGGGGQLVESTLDTIDGDDHQRLGASVVSAVHNSGNRET